MKHTPTFAAGVRRTMADQDMSLKRLERESGVGRTSIRKLIRGKGGITLENAQRIARALQHTIDSLVYQGRREEDMNGRSDGSTD